MPPTIGQLLVLAMAVICFAVGGGLSLLRLKGEDERLRIGAKACMYLGVVLSIAVIVWHSMLRNEWAPVNDNFDALVWLAVLLALFVMYMQRARPLAGLEWFVMPIVVLLLMAAGVFGHYRINTYHEGTWIGVHRVTAYGGAAVLAVAAAAGAMYIVASRRLRSKSPFTPFASLERLERLTMNSVTLGFALLSIGLVTGLGRIYLHDSSPQKTKVLLASGAWVIYAVVLHAPINPRFRGRRAAMLSVLGFVLMIGTLIAVQFLPAGAGGEGGGG